MAFSTLTVTNDWPSAPHFTASAETDIAIVNPTPGLMTVVITSSSTKPALAVTDGLALRGGTDRAITLKADERLWIAAPGLAEGSSHRATLMS